MHQQGALAYQQTTKVVESPRERESALLMKAAAGLQRVKDEWDIGTHQEVRQNIANLGMFIMNQTRDILLEVNPQPSQLDVLVRLNRQIAAGLRGS